MSFTLFVILPNEDVCSLRNLQSGTSVKTVRKQLELAAGLPAQTYRLTCSQGSQESSTGPASSNLYRLSSSQGTPDSCTLPSGISTSSKELVLMHEDHVFKLDVNVWDGFVMRAQLFDSWQELYDNIVANNIDDIVQNGAVHMRKGALVIEGENEGKVKDLVTERGVVALFLSSFLGMLDLCRALLSVGVNPNGKTPFGRTALFAAVSRDNDHVMELLLSNRASLDLRDVDGVTAVDVARRLEAKQCMRKIRHLQLQIQGRAGENGSAFGPRSSAGFTGHGRGRFGGRVIRIPSGAPEAMAVRDSSTPVSPRRPPAVRLFRESTLQTGSVVSSGTESQTYKGDHIVRNGVSIDLSFKASGSAVSRKSKEGQSLGTMSGQGHRTMSGQGHGAISGSGHATVSGLDHVIVPGKGQVNGYEHYTWENNTDSVNVARTPSAAGTEVRSPIPAVRSIYSSSGKNRLSKSYGVSWNDSVSVSSSPRMLPFRPTVHDITVPAPSPAKVLSTTTTTLRSLNKGDVDKTDNTFRRPSALRKYYLESQTRGRGDYGGGESDSFHHHHYHHDHESETEPHYPAQEPPERPPSRLESNSQYYSESELKGEHHSFGVHRGDNGSFVSSQEALSVGSAPELQTSNGLDALGARQTSASHADSDDDGGRVQTSRGSVARTSGRRSRSRLLVSRQKQTESWRTMKRRIKLAEDQKRSTSKSGKNGKQNAREQKETFEEWLERKRREKNRAGNSSESSDSDDDDEDRSAENTRAFNDWLKELKERPLNRPVTSSPASLHRRKSRPLKDLIQVGAMPDPKADPSAYISAFREWQQGRNQDSTQQTLGDIKGAKRNLEEKRKQLLAMALTYEDWLQHAEERKHLMAAILRADNAQLAQIEQQAFHARRAPRQISFSQWREKVDKREAEMRQQRQRMRKEAEMHHQENMADFRSSAAIAHEEWVRRKKDEALKARSKDKQGKESDKAVAAGSREEKEAAWEAWLERKHRSEVAQLDSHLRQERQLLFNLRQKKQPTVTPC